MKTKVDTVVTTVVDESKIKYLEEELKKEKARVKKVTIKVPVPVVDGEEPDSVAIITRQYNGTEELDNGTIGYEIYADSLHAVKFTLETKDTVINTTTEITKILPPRNKLFLSMGVEGAVTQPAVPQAASLGLMYNIKQKWAVGVEVRQDFTGLLPSNQATTVGLKVHIGL